MGEEPHTMFSSVEESWHINAIKSGTNSRPALIIFETKVYLSFPHCSHACPILEVSNGCVQWASLLGREQAETLRCLDSLDPSETSRFWLLPSHLTPVVTKGVSSYIPVLLLGSSTPMLSKFALYPPRAGLLVWCHLPLWNVLQINIR